MSKPNIHQKEKNNPTVYLSAKEEFIKKYRKNMTDREVVK